MVSGQLVVCQQDTEKHNTYTHTHTHAGSQKLSALIEPTNIRLQMILALTRANGSFTLAFGLLFLQVFEYADLDLAREIDDRRRDGRPFALPHVDYITKQLMRALSFVHRWFFHRYE